MTTLRLLSVCVVLLTTCAFVEASSPTCSSISATNLPDLNRRSRIYSASPEETLLNDQVLAEGWYSIGEYAMPQTPPLQGQCGTYYPVWMNGTVPTSSAGVQTFQACEADIYNNCTKAIESKVINCTGHGLFYYLKPTDNRFGYCFDPPALGSIAVINPKPAYQPTKPTVKMDLTWTTGRVPIPRLRFTCVFNPKRQDTDLLYNVYWFNDDKTMPLGNAIRGNESDTAYITEESLKSLGVNIKCGVRVKNGEFGLLNDMVLSDNVFAGILIHTPVVALKRGLTAKITIEPTVPFGCPPQAIRALSCKGDEGLQVSMYEPAASAGCDDGTKLAVAKAVTCGVFIDGVSYQETLTNTSINWRRNYTFEVTTANDKQTDLFRRKFLVNLKTPDFTDHKIWRGYILPSVTINIHDVNELSKSKTCYAHSDPHMKTADDQWYDCMDHGYYIVYNHKKYPMQVQMKTTPCHKYSDIAECACAVSVRAGGDIFIIDKCKDSNNTIDFKSCKDQILDVVAETETTYKVTLPTGTEVQLSMYEVGKVATLNIDIRLTNKDINSIEGLCGNFNGMHDEKADQPAFKSRWKIAWSKSLLNDNNHNPTRWSKNERLCVCKGNQTICNAKESITCQSNPNPKIFECRLKNNSGHVRRRRLAVRPDTFEADKEVEKIYTDGSRSMVNEYEVKAQFRSTYEVICPVNCSREMTPQATNGKHKFISKFDISISNDGNSFGVKFPMLVYNSQCQNLINDTAEIAFSLEDDFCYIDGQCVKDGEHKPKNNCFLCDINDPYRWTRKEVCDTVLAPGGDGSTIFDGTNNKNRHNGSASLGRLSAVIFLSTSLLFWSM